MRIRAGFPRHRSLARLCKSGSSEALASLPSDPDLFVIRRSQTTDGETHIVTMALAGDRPPRYETKRPLSVGRGPVPRQRSHYGKNVSCSLQVLTDLKHQRLTLANAGDRPPRYGNIETGRSLLPEEIEARKSLLLNASKYETPAFNLSTTHLPR